MAIKGDRDYLYLIWQDPQSRYNFIIGELSRNGEYEFSYHQDHTKAADRGFSPLVAFPVTSKKYESKVLFPAFTSRLPDKKRRDIKKILSKYHLPDYDEYEMLKKTGARLPYDNLEFIDPIFPENELVKRDFYIAGSRHYLGCHGDECIDLSFLTVGEEVIMEFEPTNPHDSNAIKITSTTEKLLGYVPRYYSETLTARMKDGSNCTLVITEVNQDSNCHNCIKVDLKIEPAKG